MASVEASKLPKADHDELACTYAALMLHDDGLEITVSNDRFLWANWLLEIQAEKLSKVIKASGNEVEPYWPMLFAKALKGQDVGELLTNLASAGPAAGPAAAGGPVEEVVEEKKEEKKEEAEDVDMGGLFGDEEDYWSHQCCREQRLNIFNQSIIKTGWEI